MAAEGAQALLPGPAGAALAGALDALGLPQGPGAAAALALAGGLAALGLRALWRRLAGGGGASARPGDLARLDAGQQQLLGALTQVAQAQAAAQARLEQGMERRLEQAQARMGDSLAGSAARTARSLGALQARLDALDAAQARIERLSGDVLGLQAILSNKQTRGAFGEIQLAEILRHALPADGYALQATLSNGRRVDALVRLAHPPGPIAIDSKFPLEPYEALVAAADEPARRRAAAALRTAVAGHIRDIAARYILPGETAGSALMFLPSEAVYAELHARFGEVVRQGFAQGVWIVSPTTLMAVLHTLRAVLRDARLAEEGARIRRELGLLAVEVSRLGARAGSLERHLRLAGADLEAVRLGAERAARRAARIEAAEFPGDGAPPADGGGAAGQGGAPPGPAP